MQHVLFAKVIIEKEEKAERREEKKRAHGVFITIIRNKTRAIIKCFFRVRAYINPWVFKSFSSSNSFKWIDCKHLIDEILCFRCYCVPLRRWILQTHAKYKQWIRRKPSQREAISFLLLLCLSFDFLCNDSFYFTHLSWATHTMRGRQMAKRFKGKKRKWGCDTVCDEKKTYIIGAGFDLWIKSMLIFVPERWIADK